MKIFYAHKINSSISYIVNEVYSFSLFIGSNRYPYHSNSSSDSEEEILRRLKLQQSISSHSGQISKYGGLNSPLNHLDGFQSIHFDQNGTIPIEGITSPNSSSKPLKHSSSRTSSYYRNNHNPRDLLGQAERGKIGSHSSSECSSNSSFEASVESNMGLINHEKKGKCQDFVYIISLLQFLFILSLYLSHSLIHAILMNEKIE
jgi:hypothetical protein